MVTLQELSDQDKAIIAQEARLLAMVLEGLRLARARSRLNIYGMGERLVELREQATEARAEDLPALFDQMNNQRALIEQSQGDDFPDSRSPYFAHLQLEEQGRIRDILLGYKTFLDVSGAPVNDWRNAPIAAVFFNYRQGEEFEQELPGRIATGIVRQRHLLTIKDGELVYIGTPEKTLRRESKDQPWYIEGALQSPSLAGGSGQASRGTTFGTGRSGQPSPEVSALLDSQQYGVLSSHEDDPVLVLGGAGCGKTTVALHRLATLNFRDKHRFAQHKLAVIVPDEGLVRLSRKLLDSLGLHRVLVSSFDKFFMDRVYQVVRRLPRKICHDPPGSVVFFKRHVAMRTMLREFIELQALDFCHELQHKLPQSDEAQRMIREETTLPLMQRLARAKATKSRQQDPEHMREKRWERVFHDLEKRAMDLAKDRLDIFMNKTLLDRVIDLAGGQIQRHVAESVYRHAVDQFADSASKRYAGVDLENLETVDGGSLSDEFVDDIAQSIDPEDFAILYELRRVKLGLTRGDDEGLHLFSHIVIDEAQDLAPIELSALGAALEETGSVTIAGDSAQQIDPSTTFESWEAILDNIGVPRVTAQHLMTTYRSPRPVAEFAHKVLGPYAPREMPKSIKEGVPVMISVFPNEGHMMISLADGLSELMAREPGASVAVIVRTPENAQRVFRMMTDVPRARLVEGGQFDFRPGVDIVEVGEVKGLEFDYVIVPDANPNAYPDTPEARRALHVAATRAIHQLWIIAVGLASPILPAQE